MDDPVDLPPIPTELLDYLADYFRVLGEPMRLRILNLLYKRELCVQDLVIASQTSQANVSKHLKVMVQVGILNRRTVGTSAYYSVADDLTFELCHLVHTCLLNRIQAQANQFQLLQAAAKPLN
jgi:DNA-binding transcriptional ArsR family regulator